jgi:hypothetical protein
MIRWACPSSTARRASLTREVSADSDTNRSPHTASGSSSLGHDPVAIDDQMVQQPEHLGLDVDGPGGPGEREPPVV